jgi:hypothetical protein
MSSKEEEIQISKVQKTLVDFVKILVKEYPLILKSGSAIVEVNPSTQQSFPYDVSLKIIKKE